MDYTLVAKELREEAMNLIRAAAALEELSKGKKTIKAPVRRRLSAAARERIADAQRQRWAKAKREARRTGKLITLRKAA